MHYVYHSKHSCWGRHHHNDHKTVNSLALQGRGLAPGPICADCRLKGEDFLRLVLKQMLQSLKVPGASSAAPGMQSCWTLRFPPGRLQMPEERCCALLRPQRHRQVLPPDPWWHQADSPGWGREEKPATSRKFWKPPLSVCPSLHGLCFPTVDTFSYFYSAKYNLIKLTLNFFSRTPHADKWLVAGLYWTQQIANTSTINLGAPTARVAAAALTRSSQPFPCPGAHGTEGF